MTATDDYAVDPAMRQPATGAGEGGDGPQLARARDGIVAQILALLPDAESIRRSSVAFSDFASGVWSGEIWDIQPPSPRELADRVLQGPWATSGSPLLRFLAKTGMVATLAWSVPLYTLAVLSQRFWRATWAITVMVLIHQWL